MEYTKQEMIQTYGERLGSALKHRNIKQADLAKKLSISQTAISKIINGVQFLDFDLAVKACEILDISLNWLAHGTDNEPKTPFYRNPERQRIEYLISIMEKAEYPLIIVAMEEIIEIRIKNSSNSGVLTEKTAKSGRSKRKNGRNKEI
jgi:transcriptional regulator with XRE-family HTH domain